MRRGRPALRAWRPITTAACAAGGVHSVVGVGCAAGLARPTSTMFLAELRMATRCHDHCFLRRFHGQRASETPSCDGAAALLAPKSRYLRRDRPGRRMTARARATGRLGASRGSCPPPRARRVRRRAPGLDRRWAACRGEAPCTLQGSRPRARRADDVEHETAMPKGACLDKRILLCVSPRLTWPRRVRGQRDPPCSSRSSWPRGTACEKARASRYWPWPREYPGSPSKS